MCTYLWWYMLFPLEKKKVDKPIMTVYGNTKEINSTQANEIKPKENIENNSQHSLFSSPATEDMAKNFSK